MADTTRMTKDAAISVVPANEAGWEDLQSVFGLRGYPAKCQCQRYKIRTRGGWTPVPVEERALHLRMETQCGNPRAKGTSGLVAYMDDEPVGWCAVEARGGRRTRQARRGGRIPWRGAQRRTKRTPASGR